MLVEGLRDLDVSLIIAVFSLATLIFAPLNKRIKSCCGLKTAMVTGCFLISATTYGLGALVKINDPMVFLAAALVLRFFQGIGDSFLQVTAYS